MKKWALIAAATPVFLVVFLFSCFWEWWHFGASQQLLRFGRDAKKRLMAWRESL